jgi:hypothetical protein
LTAPNAILSSAEYSGSRIRSWPTIAPRNQIRIRSVIGAVLSNQPAAAAPAIIRLASSASRCSGLAPYSRRKRALIG